VLVVIHHQHTVATTLLVLDVVRTPSAARNRLEGARRRVQTLKAQSLTLLVAFATHGASREPVTVCKPSAVNNRREHAVRPATSTGPVAGAPGCRARQPTARAARAVGPVTRPRRRRTLVSPWPDMLFNPLCQAEA
jgi:hypothetical protein